MTNLARMDMNTCISSRLSKAEVLVYRKHFNVFDLNGDGVISARELYKVSRTLGYRLSHKEIQDIMLALDLDDSGTLSFDEFLRAMPANDQISNCDHKAAEICRTFMEYDRDGNGQVTIEEAHTVLRRELAFDLQETIELVRHYDRNGDGQLSYEEFVDFYKRVRAKANQVHEMFNAFDLDHNGAVSLGEAQYVLNKLEISDRDVEGLVAIYDKNKDGELQYEEFVAFLLHS